MAAEAELRVKTSGRRTGRQWRDGLERRLYVCAPRLPLSRRRLVWGVLGFVGAMAISAIRTGGGGALNSIWIEDAQRFLTAAYNDPPMDALTTGFNGYFHTGPRILAEVASAVPVRWSASALTFLALLVLATFTAVVYTASGAHFHQVWLRVLVALPTVAFPVGHTQADNDVATLQFPALYTLFWLFLWRPQRLPAKVLAVVIAGCATLSSILPVVLLPMVVLRVLVTRDRVAVLMAAAFGAGLAVQFNGMITGATSRDGIGTFRPDPVWVGESIITRLVPRSVFGEKALGGPGTDVNGYARPLDISNHAIHILLIVGAWLIVAGVIVLALRHVTDPNWVLATVAAATAVLLFSVAIVQIGVVEPRYLIPSVGLMYVTFAALLRPKVMADQASEKRSFLSRVTNARWALAFALVASLVMVANLRGANSRSRSLPWDRIVAQAEATCANPAVGSYTYRYTWWRVKIPCERVR